MSRQLRVLRGADPLEVQDALGEALEGGRALLPLPGDAPAPPLAEVEDPVALVVRTSGSTGDAKLVALAAAALRAGSTSAAERLGGVGQWLLALPAQYIAGLNVLTRSIDAGTTPVLLPPGPFDPAAFARSAAELTHENRFTSLVPAQLARLLDDPAGLDALRSFRAVLIGGQATPRILRERASEAGVRVVCTYGSSETAGGCVYDGVPLEGTRVRVVDGEVQLAGPTLALGYLDEEATRLAFIRDDGARWYRTGDAGELVNGTLTVTGRLDDQIVSGGVNVSLGAVENVLRRMPGLTDAVVVARADERWGTVPVVVCTSTVDLAELRAEVASTLGPAAAPAAAVQVDAIPMLASGKPDRLAITRLADH